MFKLFRRRKPKTRQELQQAKNPQENADVPVSHLLIPWNSLSNREVVKARHPHMVTEFLPKDKIPKWQDDESLE